MSETPETTVPQPPAERVFPPWSVGRIVLWTSVFQGVSIFSVVPITLLVVSLGIWLNQGVDASVVELSRLIIRAISGPAALALIVGCTRRAGFSLTDLWGSSPIALRQIVPTALLGIAFMSSVGLLSRIVFGDLPRTAPSAPWDWRLLFAVEILSDAVIVVIAEELLFRGLLYRAFRLRYPIWMSIMFSTFIFSLIHTHYLYSPFQQGVVFLLGAISALLFERTQSLNSSIAFHAAANATTISVEYLSSFVELF